jgi:hypothetical protein
MDASPSTAVRTVTRPAAPTYPASVPSSRKLPKKPRRLSGAYSAMKVDAPPYSPPVEKPWTSRNRISSTGAQKPMDA